MDAVDHVLIFAGDLGHFGGNPDIDRFVEKIDELQYKYTNVEIGWDGGVNAANVVRLAGLGIDVLNVGGFIQYAKKPAEAYATLKALAEKQR
jgi:pentose-5-phosphate-3-epimerase